jgi:hypothetical protein
MTHKHMNTMQQNSNTGTNVYMMESSLMFILCIIRRSRKQPTLCTELFHSFIQYTPAHTRALHDIPPILCITSNSDGSKKLPDDCRLLLRHVGASILNKGVVQFSAQRWLFSTIMEST